MTATARTGRSRCKPGDVLSITTTYDSTRASWYESMGIMVVWMADGARAAPTRSRQRSTSPGMLTHGHLPENDNHGGKARRRCPTRPTLAVGAGDRPASTSATSSTGSGDMRTGEHDPDA